MVEEHAAIKDMTEIVTAVNTNRFMKNPPFFFQNHYKNDFQENMEMCNELNKRRPKLSASTNDYFVTTSSFLHLHYFYS